jgi:hypothetical protein
MMPAAHSSPKRLMANDPVPPGASLSCSAYERTKLRILLRGTR